MLQNNNDRSNSKIVEIFNELIEIAGYEEEKIDTKDVKAMSNATHNVA